jgi:hypothetical protein
MSFILALVLAVAGLWLAYHFVRGFVAGFLEGVKRTRQPSLKIVRDDSEAPGSLRIL